MIALITTHIQMYEVMKTKRLIVRSLKMGGFFVKKKKKKCLVKEPDVNILL